MGAEAGFRAMTTPLDKALKRLAELQREIDEVTKFIELYQRFEGKVVDTGTQMTLFESMRRNS